VTATITVTDNDGDVVSTNVSTTNPLSIEFVDTSPVSLTPTAIHMIDLATAPAITENLHFVSGADGVQTVKFTITDGVAAIDESTGNQLAYNGQELYLHYGQTNGVIDYTIIVATTSSALAPNGVLTTDSNVAYWIDINPDPLSGVGGSYTMHSNGVISNGTETTATNLSSVGGGNVVLKAISNIGGTTEDVILTTKAGLTVNTNANVIGIGSGQSFSGTDGIRFDFTNGTVSGNGGNAVYTADGTHNLTTSFKQEISLTAGASHADITIKAIVADSDNVYYGDADEGSVSITGVRVYSGTLAQVQAGTATEILDGQSVNGITLDYTINGDGTVNIVGLQSGWVFVVETTDSFSALQIDSLNTTGNYKLGMFSYGESSAGDPVDLSYNIVGIDGDGDTVSGSLAATLYPASATQSGVNDGTPNDTLTGTINTDYLLGNLGDDVLSGLGGNDVLVGGAGIDTLTGGSGVDRFVMTNGDGPDIITDFTLGNLNPVNGAVSANADILDISDVLAGAEITAAEFALSPGSFITFVQSGSDTNVVLDLDGVAGGTTHVVATLQNTTATNFDINTLIGNGQIDYTS
jgi:Ca2+-binding RTX toxin-like protein